VSSLGKCGFVSSLGKCGFVSSLGKCGLGFSPWLICGQFSPTRADLVFQDWWANLEAKVPHALRKGINSLVMLVAWWLWKQRNKCVFEGMLLVATRLFRTSKTTLRGGVSRVPKIWAPSGLSLGAVLAVF
jgi:hypothetical protein